jgi:hypothetical protein
MKKTTPIFVAITRSQRIEQNIWKNDGFDDNENVLLKR